MAAIFDKDVDFRLEILVELGRLSTRKEMPEKERKFQKKEENSRKFQKKGSQKIPEKGRKFQKKEEKSGKIQKIP